VDPRLVAEASAHKLLELARNTISQDVDSQAMTVAARWCGSEIPVSRLPSAFSSFARAQAQLAGEHRANSRSAPAGSLDNWPRCLAMAAERQARIDFYTHNIVVDAVGSYAASWHNNRASREQATQRVNNLSRDVGQVYLAWPAAGALEEVASAAHSDTRTWLRTYVRNVERIASEAQRTFGEITQNRNRQRTQWALEAERSRHLGDNETSWFIDWTTTIAQSVGFDITAVMAQKHAVELRRLWLTHVIVPNEEDVDRIARAFELDPMQVEHFVDCLEQIASGLSPHASPSQATALTPVRRSSLGSTVGRSSLGGSGCVL
jgi:hypothetical protein